MATNAAPSTPAAQAAASRLAGMRPPAAAPAAAAPPEPVPEEKKGRKSKKGGDADGGKKKKPVKPILLGLLVLVVAYEVKGKVMKPHYGPHNPVPAGTIYDFPGQVTTNLPDGSLAQISMSLQLTKVGSVKVVTKDNSELMGTATQIVGEHTYSQLLSPAGRVALQHQLVAAFQKELGMTEGAQAVSAVYFTSFVLQQQ
jgi:flagellar basal body-associated protein FliL